MKCFFVDLIVPFVSFVQSFLFERQDVFKNGVYFPVEETFCCLLSQVLGIICAQVLVELRVCEAKQTDLMTLLLLSISELID